MATTSLSSMQQSAPAVPDQTVDMFSARGFELAVRIAKAFAHSDAVPAQFRQTVEKRGPGGSQWIENPSALGNCIVAIETARAVGMSITAVMQNANVIEGRLSWSAQFVIAAINASGRFTPLRFQLRNLGRIKAKYRVKLGYNKSKGGYDFEEKAVEIDDVECIAWALPRNVAIPPNVYTLDQAKAAGLPVIEGAPVSIKLAVEEGWYGKSGSKWQTGMSQLMLQYRAGAFFGRIHAPDIVMGMGRTTEEIIDVAAVEIPSVAPGHTTTLSELAASGEAREVREVSQLDGDEPPTGEVEPPAPAPAALTDSPSPTFDFQAFADRIKGCKDLETLQLLSDEAEDLPQGPQRDQVMQVLLERDLQLANARAPQQAQQTTERPAARRSRPPMNLE